MPLPPLPPPQPACLPHPPPPSSPLPGRWFGFRHKFIATLDVDEYVVLKGLEADEKPDLPGFLSQYEKYGGLMVHWQLFGPSGHVLRPRGGGTLPSYTQCVPRAEQQEMKEFQAIPLGFMKSFTNTA